MQPLKYTKFDRYIHMMILFFFHKMPKRRRESRQFQSDLHGTQKSGPLRRERPAGTVKKQSTGCRNRAAGELEGARPASNWISERPKMPISGIFGYRILPSGKIRARKAQSKKTQMDFFDNLTS